MIENRWQMYAFAADGRRLRAITCGYRRENMVDCGFIVLPLRTF